MHPNGVFAWSDEAAMRRFVAQRGFAHLCVVSRGLPMIAHVPVVVEDDGALRFHIARANRMSPFLEGGTAVASVTGSDFYVSPDWYGLRDQVPTWNYVAVEVEGVLHPLDDEAMAGQLDKLSAVFEAPLAPKPAWTNAKLSAGRFARMCRAIVGYELRPTEWRGTIKLGQDKPATAREGVAAALGAGGRDDAARMMREGVAW